MSDREILNKLFREHKITAEDMSLIDSLYSVYQDNIYFTGSAKWGCSAFNDIDFFLNDSCDCLQNESRFAGCFEPRNGGSLGSLKFKNSNVNIICLRKVDVLIWKAATRMMAELPPIENKNTRCAMFEILRSVARVAIFNS